MRVSARRGAAVSTGTRSVVPVARSVSSTTPSARARPTIIRRGCRSVRRRRTEPWPGRRGRPAAPLPPLQFVYQVLWPLLHQGRAAGGHHQAPVEVALHLRFLDEQAGHGGLLPMPRSSASRKRGGLAAIRPGFGRALTRRRSVCQKIPAQEGDWFLLYSCD